MRDRVSLSTSKLQEQRLNKSEVFLSSCITVGYFKCKYFGWLMPSLMLLKINQAFNAKNNFHVVALDLWYCALLVIL